MMQMGMAHYDDEQQNDDLDTAQGIHGPHPSFRHECMGEGHNHNDSNRNSALLPRRRLKSCSNPDVRSKDDATAGCEP